MAMVLGMFMAILDIQIVSASIADIQAGLAASPDEASWVQTSYLIAEIVMIPLSGFLSRHAVHAGAVHALAPPASPLFSFACAFATSLPVMVAFRAAQGFLGGAMIPTVFATSFLLFPPAARAKVSVLIGLTATLAPTIGPTLGGLLTDSAVLALAVPDQRAGRRLAVAAVVWSTIDIDQPDRSLLRALRLVGAGRDGAVPRQPGIRDGGRAALGLAGGPRPSRASPPSPRRPGIGFFWRALTAAQTGGGAARLPRPRISPSAACSASSSASGSMARST